MRYLCLAFLFFCFTANGQVVERANLPHLDRDDAIAFSIGNYGFIVTGNHNGFSESNRLWRYNAYSDYWNEGPAFPGTPRQYASSFSIGSSAYIVGGISEDGTPLKDVWEYSANSNSWNQLGDFPGVARWGASACSHDNFGYVVGGTNGQTCSNSFWRFTPNDQTWDSLSSYPGTGTREGVLLALTNKLVYVGGFSINPLTCHQETFIFNFDTFSWSTGTDFPLAQSSYLSGNGLLNNGYVFSGWGCDNTFSNSIWETDGITWTLKDTLPFIGIRGMSSFTQNGCIYALTGLDASNQKTNRVFRIGTETALDDVIVYPNPAPGWTHVVAPIGAELVVYDMTGKIVLEEIAHSMFNFISLDSGSYTIRITSPYGNKNLRLIVL